MSAGKENERWVLGVVLGLLGSIAINTGNNIQSLGLQNLKSKTVNSKKKNTTPFRKDHAKTVPECVTNEEGAQHDNIKSHTSTTWLIGTVVFVSGSLLNFASYAFAAQSMLASLESIQFVTNLIFGKFMLRAHVTKTMLLGTILTVTGTIIAVQFSSKETLDLDTKDIKVLYSNPGYIVYLVLMIGLLFLLHFVYRYYERRKSDGKELNHTDIIIPLTYSISSALFGTQSTVQAKVLAELLAVQSSKKENVFESWFTYFTIIYWVTTVVVWLSRLNRALTIFNPLLIIPMLQCSFIFFAIVSGGIFFQEFNGFSSTQWVGFWFGIMVMFSGLVLLTPRHKRVEEEMTNVVTNLLKANDEKICSGNNEHKKDEQVHVVQNDLLRSEARTHGCEKSNSAQKNLQPESFKENPIVRDKPNYLSPIRLSWMSPQSESENTDNANKKKRRSPRHSLTQSAVVVVKDALIESAKGVIQCSNLLLEPHNGTGALTDVMISLTKEEDMRSMRKAKLKKLRELLTLTGVSPKELLTSEVIELAYDLELEYLIFKNGSSIKMDNFKSMEKNLLTTPRTIRHSVLEKASELEKALEFNSTHKKVVTNIIDCEMQNPIT
jgi:hypothetical protein